jgi:hypothetical protein
MNASQISDVIRVGEIKLGTRMSKAKNYTAYSNALVLDWDTQFPKQLKKAHLAIVYFIFVNGELYKIGQTSGKSGIRGCMNFYLNAGIDDPGQNRFAINYMMREELKKGNTIEVYMKYQAPVKVEFTSMFGVKHITETAIDPKGLEHVCVEEYIQMYKRYPVWNYQEAGIQLPQHISEAFANFKLNRALSKKTP